ncbi:MAG: glycoside hydrolase family 3 C-terminal domain-containing protein [Muribaculaceae bacterium]|nr:glycoside hydrolase family 3 C-terminal domain-containing protein [Muribaculaceae bacterium]
MLAMAGGLCSLSVMAGHLTPAEVDAKCDSLMALLTVDEKISLMMNDSPAIDRVGIPKYDWWNEALHGVGRCGLATVFPQAIGLAATWDDDALQQTFGMVGDEARAKYNYYRNNNSFERYQGLTFWTPNVNIFRDPRWGRGQETYGEDPYLSGRMGSAVVRGLQGDDPEAMKVMACAKHYAVHSGPEWNRHTFDAKDINYADLYDTYLPAFKALVDAGVGQVMCAYNRYEGEPCCGSNRLLQQILRDDWGYKGLVVSDCGAVGDFFYDWAHKTHPDASTASAAAVIAGTDLECGDAYRNLRAALDKGLIDEAAIDKSVRRVLHARIALGELFPSPTDERANTSIDIVDSERHRQAALDMARKSMTLLKNNGVLPLKHGAKVTVMGPNAVDSTMMWGNYNGFPSHTVTILEGIQKKNGAGVSPYVAGCGHIESLDYNPADVTSDVVIFVGGISPQFEGEEMTESYEGFQRGDREIIELPKVQREFLRQLKKAGKKIIFVNCSGSAIGLEEEAPLCDAILQAWYPGQAGGDAVADVIFGDYNPAGRLPVTFYKSTAQLPDYQDYSMENRTYRFMKDEPEFVFGHGLSYSDFKYGKAKLSGKVLAKGGKLKLTVPVANVGKMDGDEVVQLYMRRVGDYVGPVKSLRDFKRVGIKAGEKAEVPFVIDEDTFKAYNTENGTVEAEAGEYELLYGGTSADKGLKSIKVTVK